MSTETTPWRPSSLLHISKDLKATLASKGLSPRWVTKQNVEKYLAEGWEIYKSFSPAADAPNSTAIDGKPVDGTNQKRNLILMVMPVEMVKQRAAFYEGLTSDAAKDSLNELKSATGGNAYGELEIDGKKV